MKNHYIIKVVDGVECVEFETNKKHKVKVLVDKDLWFDYLCQFNWTATKNKNGRVEPKTSINKQTRYLHRVIIEYVKEELEHWGTTIDHKNNNNLDNRLLNLRIYNTLLLNTTNIKSKVAVDDMQYIHKQKHKTKNGQVTHGYKVHFNIGNKTYYKNFKTLEDAKDYRNREVPKIRNKVLENLIKKNRDIEFERGFKDKLHNCEIDEINEILNKYGYKLANI